MLAHINKNLSKQVARLKSSLTQKTQYSVQEINEKLAQMQNNLQSSFKNTLDLSDKNLTETKNQLKKNNKIHSQFKLAVQKRQIQMSREFDLLRRRSDKNQNKIKQLLKISLKYEKLQDQMEQTEQKRPMESKGTQCEFKDPQMQKILQDLKQQNIFLTEKISQLQQKINQNEENIDAANILIKELVMQLDTNDTDRGYCKDTDYQSDLSDQNSLQMEEETVIADQSSDLEPEFSQESADCGREASDYDNSTVDGSNSTSRDFALPQWLQFDEPMKSPQSEPLYQLEEENMQMWPQLIWRRIRRVLGYNQQS